MTEQESAARERFVSLITRDTLALVLAGGKGTRLGALTSHRVKPAVPFGGHFRIIDFALSNCVNSGVRRIGILTQYKAHSLIQHVHKGWGFFRAEFDEFIELLPAQQRNGEGWYAGTADAVHQNMDIIRLHDPAFVLVLGGDHVYKMDYGNMLGFHVNRNADVTVGCMPVPRIEARAFGVMQVDDRDRVIDFVEKPDDPPTMPDAPSFALASMGIYVFGTEYLLNHLAQDASDPNSSHDFGRDVIPRAVRESAVYAYRFQDIETGGPAYWRDVGDIDSYWHANLELTQLEPELNVYDRRWPILTYQQQYPPAKFVHDEDGRRGSAVSSMVAGGCIVSGAAVRNSLVSSDVQIEEHSSVEHSVILPHVRIGRDVQIRRAIIETGCKIPDGTRIGNDPDADHSRFEVSKGGVVLVTPEMLNQMINYVR